MVAKPFGNFGRNLTLRIACLPVLAAVGVAIFEMAIGGQGLPAAGPIAIGLAAPIAIPAAPAAATSTPLALFRAPAAVAVRGTTLFISDVPTNGIWARDLVSGAETLIAGAHGSGNSGDGGLATDAQLMGPRGLAIDAAGNLFVADSGNHEVRKIAPDGTITTVAGDGTPGFSGDGGRATRAQLNTPNAVAVDSHGNLYIADTLNHRIRKVSRTGIIDTVAGNGALSRVSRGTGGFGFSGDGGPAIFAQLSIPEGVAVDSRGNLYIADTGNDRVRKVDTNGIIRTIAGTGKNSYSGDGGPAVRGNLYAPVGLAIGPGGSLYISERAHHTIRMITAGGKMIAVAGRGGIRGYFDGNGSALRARLNDPQGIALGPGYELYIADAGNHRIRVVSSAGKITTLT
jgi:sugar lactone lactonase YvrE